MSTSAITPAAPAAVSTPVVSTPAPAVSSGAPSTPATPVTPVVSPAVSPSTPETPATPAAATPAAGKPEPQRGDFQSERDWIAAHFDWQDEQAGIASPVEAAPAEAEILAPGEVPAEEKTPEELAAEAEAQPEPVAEEHESLTPEAVSALEAKTPELHDFFEAHPEVKGAFYETARKLAKAAPIADLFPDLPSAQFAIETANSTVDVKGGFLRAAEDPSQIGPAFDKFTDLFREYDDKGQPMVDAGGNPVLGKDFELLTNHIVTSYFDGEISDAKERIKANKYTNDTARESDETLVQAYEFIKRAKDADPSEMERPDTSGLPDDVRQNLERREAEIKRREEEAGIRNKTQDAATRKAERQTHETKVATTVGQNFGKRLDDTLKAKLDSGVHIPAYVLQSIDPASGVSYFAKSIYDKFMESTIGRWDRQAKKFVGGTAKLRNDFATLEAMPPSDQAAQQRVDFFNKLTDEYLPRIFEAEVKKIQGADRAERLKRGQKEDAARAAVQPEPRAGSAPRPVTMTWDTAYKQAEAEVTKESAGKFMSDGDRQEAINRKVGRLMF